MKLNTLKASLREHPDRQIRFILPDGDPIPAEFHVTEVGRVTKHFIDCGGTIRTQESCLLQTWVADDDSDHRLHAGKLAGILELAKKVVPTDEFDVEVEYEGCVVAQYTIEAAAVQDGELHFTLGNKKTDCLAREACGVSPAGAGADCGCGSGEGKCC